MNFIDRAFDAKLRGDDFLQAMADIYDEPEVREILDKYPQFVKDVILLIDYDYEMQMEGLDNIIYGYFGEQNLSAILQAMDNCGITKEADLLRQAKAMNPDEYDENYGIIYDKFAIHNPDDYDAFWDSVRSYIDASLPY